MAIHIFQSIAVKVTARCAILHNFCLRDGDMFEPVEEALGPDDGGGEHQPDLQCGEQLCGCVATVLSAPNNTPPALHDRDY